MLNFYFLTQFSDLSVERTTHGSAVEGQPGKAVMADSVATQQQPGNFVPLQRKHIFTDPALKNL